ncbi:MAG: hypothetical protein C0614_04665 [Desulfuromonas sp.]|nr:MAG: hypothetical protein C0614_04665 [Desulfuromonas sp.]
MSPAKQSYILAIEDNPSVCTLLFACLNKAGFRTTIVETGEEGLRLIEERLPDLLILDLKLPGINGLDVCRTLRRDPWMSGVPVLMLTGQSEEGDVIAGLEVGADDYMSKPFSPKLLVARVKALLRRSSKNDDGRVHAEEGPPGPDGLPVLRVKTLGYCDLRLNGRNLPWGVALSAAQRQLMAMLITAPEHQIPLEEVQATCWPDSNDARARSSFDTLLARVRRSFEEGLGPIDSKQYLLVRRGYVHLNNCQIDAQEFDRLVNKGFKHAKGRNLWQAELAFSSAFSLWQGPFLPGNFGSDRATAFQGQLELLYLEGSELFARILAEAGRAQEAIKLLRSAQSYCPTDEKTIKLLYQLCLALELPGQARQILHAYLEALQRDGFSEQERSEIMTRLPSEPPSSWLAHL